MMRLESNLPQLPQSPESPAPDSSGSIAKNSEPTGAQSFIQILKNLVGQMPGNPNGTEAPAEFQEDEITVDPAEWDLVSGLSSSEAQTITRLQAALGQLLEQLGLEPGETLGPHMNNFSGVTFDEGEIELLETLMASGTEVPNEEEILNLAQKFPTASDFKQELEVLLWKTQLILENPRGKIPEREETALPLPAVHSGELLPEKETGAEAGSENPGRHRSLWERPFTGLESTSALKAPPASSAAAAIAGPVPAPEIAGPVSTSGDPLFMGSSQVERGVFEQVRMGLSTLMKNGVKRIEIQLVPEHLGRLKISLDLKSEGLTGKISVQNDTVKHIVEGQLAQLRESLEAQSYKVETLGVSVESGPEEQAPQNEWAHHLLYHKRQDRGRAAPAELETLVSAAQELDTGRRWGYNTLEFVA